LFGRRRARLARGRHRYVLLIDPIRKRVRSWGAPPENFYSPEDILAEILH